MGQQPARSKCSRQAPAAAGASTNGAHALDWIRSLRLKRKSKRNFACKEGGDMLVLSRKLGERILIGENICITVVDIDRGKIRLGIDAPRDVPVFRQELIVSVPKAPAVQPAIIAK
jgi:carbon storage regulator